MLQAPFAHAAHHRLGFLVPAAFELPVQTWHGLLPTATPHQAVGRKLTLPDYPKIYRSPYRLVRPPTRRSNAQRTRPNTPPRPVSAPAQEHSGEPRPMPRRRDFSGPEE